jgi:hypothetical protein
MHCSLHKIDDLAIAKERADSARVGLQSTGHTQTPNVTKDNNTLA